MCGEVKRLKHLNQNGKAGRLLKFKSQTVKGQQSPRSIVGTQNGRWSYTRNKVSPISSLGGRYQSKPTARKAELLRGYGNLEKANAASRKETGNWADRGFTLR